MLIDTHCHIHEDSYSLDTDEVLQHARDANVEKMICVGTDGESSRQALAFASEHHNVFAAIGVHPHEAKDGWQEVEKLARTTLASAQLASGVSSPLVAIGEIGLDYFYLHSPRDVQIRALKEQIDIALAYDLPIIFHVRDAFDDFWPLFDSYNGKIRGVLHSFTDSMAHMQAGIDRGLYIGVNGISTFTKDEAQQATFAAVPLDKLLLETDAPFLTPIPLRGRVNEPAFVKYVAEHHATIRGLSPNKIASTTTANAHALFAV